MSLISTLITRCKDIKGFVFDLKNLLTKPLIGKKSKIHKNGKNIKKKKTKKPNKPTVEISETLNHRPDKTWSTGEGNGKPIQYSA